MKRFILLSAGILLVNSTWSQSNINVADNLVIENIPGLSTAYISEVKNYTESRAASLFNLHPLK
jgi:hypothetical protein